MKFTNRQEKISWLQKVAAKIKELETRRAHAIMGKQFAEATQLLKAADFAKAQFRRVSDSLRPK